MHTYQLMQASPGRLRAQIQASTGTTKWTLIWALLLRDLALLGFAMVYIGAFSTLLGPTSGYVGVASFCFLLSLRFVNYGYHITASLGALAGILAVSGIASILLPTLPVLAAWGLNGLNLLLILRLTSQQPLLGNGGVYAFGYLLITGIPVSGAEIAPRLIALAGAWCLCGAVMWRHHHRQNTTVSCWSVVRLPTLDNAVFRWQLRLTIGISTALAVGQFMHVQRTMWLGFACMSLLLPLDHQLRGRAVLRFSGVVLGSGAFLVSLHLLPLAWAGLLAPVAGFLLGLTPSYFWASVLNCFGALSMARTLFGLTPAVTLRIWNNGIGILCALFVAASGHWWWQHHHFRSTI